MIVTYTFVQLSEATDNFAQANLLHKDTVSSSYLGMLFGAPVVVKRLHMAAGCDLDCFEAEMQNLCHVKHAHIVQILGWCPSRLCVVSEFLRGGSLTDCLTEPWSSDSPLSWAERLRVCSEMASALLYLHKRGIVHRNLKLENVLMDSENQSKLANMELAPLGFGMLGSDVDFSEGYADPSYLHTGALTFASDVYALGLIILQVFTGKPNVQSIHAYIMQSDSLQSRSSLNGASQQKRRGSLSNRVAFLEEKLDPAVPVRGSGDEALRRVLELALLCLEKDPVARPGLDELEAVLLLASQTAGLGSTQRQPSSGDVNGGALVGQVHPHLGMEEGDDLRVPTRGLGGSYVHSELHHVLQGGSQSLESPGVGARMLDSDMEAKNMYALGGYGNEAEQLASPAGASSSLPPYVSTEVLHVLAPFGSLDLGETIAVGERNGSPGGASMVELPYHDEGEVMGESVLREQLLDEDWEERRVYSYSRAALEGAAGKVTAAERGMALVGIAAAAEDGMQETIVQQSTLPQGSKNRRSGFQSDGISKASREEGEEDNGGAEFGRLDEMIPLAEGRREHAFSDDSPISAYGDAGRTMTGRRTGVGGRRIRGSESEWTSLSGTDYARSSYGDSRENSPLSMQSEPGSGRMKDQSILAEDYCSPKGRSSNRGLSSGPNGPRRKLRSGEFSQTDGGKGTRRSQEESPCSLPSEVSHSPYDRSPRETRGSLWTTNSPNGSDVSPNGSARRLFGHEHFAASSAAEGYQVFSLRSPGRQSQRAVSETAEDSSLYGIDPRRHGGSPPTLRTDFNRSAAMASPRESRRVLWPTEVAERQELSPGSVYSRRQDDSPRMLQTGVTAGRVRDRIIAEINRSTAQGASQRPALSKIGDRSSSPRPWTVRTPKASREGSVYLNSTSLAEGYVQRPIVRPSSVSPNRPRFCQTVTPLDAAPLSVAPAAGALTDAFAASTANGSARQPMEAGQVSLSRSKSFSASSSADGAERARTEADSASVLKVQSAGDEIDAEFDGLRTHVQSSANVEPSAPSLSPEKEVGAEIISSDAASQSRRSEDDLTVNVVKPHVAAAFAFPTGPSEEDSSPAALPTCSALLPARQSSAPSPSRSGSHAPLESHEAYATWTAEFDFPSDADSSIAAVAQPTNPAAHEKIVIAPTFAESSQGHSTLCFPRTSDLIMPRTFSEDTETSFEGESQHSPFAVVEEEEEEEVTLAFETRESLRPNPEDASRKGEAPLPNFLPSPGRSAGFELPAMIADMRSPSGERSSAATVHANELRKDEWNDEEERGAAAAGGRFSEADRMAMGKKRASAQSGAEQSHELDGRGDVLGIPESMSPGCFTFLGSSSRASSSSSNSFTPRAPRAVTCVLPFFNFVPSPSNLPTRTSSSPSYANFVPSPLLSPPSSSPPTDASPLVPTRSPPTTNSTSPARLTRASPVKLPKEALHMSSRAPVTKKRGEREVMASKGMTEDISRTPSAPSVTPERRREGTDTAATTRKACDTPKGAGRSFMSLVGMKRSGRRRSCEG
eukprot:TRINITY_DN1559_c1_g2_i1.p1 TRINITY_DN1559_c1_g2~~TRINITY_DN1559_c1_g2_i1.p1  ORF type:complete len:1523 (-),score=240.55 TRINITY_DN1559_c1_g2_i1:536-5104(-)